MSTTRSLDSKRTRPQPPVSLNDTDITTRRVDRRSFLARAVAASSIAIGAAMTAACPGGTDGTDADNAPQ